ncbi:transcriptional regulator with XRE-family HTH domain [Actinokineospora baliensis]|uniref:helix-turn-helix domain-containing protein n=1 Tax=Actinokineospora baliensis TaxID=547056 RepID=UPI001EF8AA41|nr:helix-turn-helix transcriptional regulator [Actinokineospora baliensis]MBM7774310.1 transcriptional regulator with XRE-family HTH domain [Actinokineospora baliensis]
MTKLRRAAGHTQESLAAALLVARITVYRWEAGLTVPQAGMLPDLAELLSVSPAELDTLFATSSVDDRVQHGTPDQPSVADLRQVVEGVGHRYDQTPAASLLVIAGKALAQVTESVRGGARGRARYELCAVEAEAATLAGQLIWDASQRRDHHSAHAYFQQAVDAAEEIGDAAAAGAARLRMSYLFLYGQRDPRSGRDLTAHVADVAVGASRTVAGLAHLHNAEAHAMLGDASECEKALGRAETLLAGATGDDSRANLLSEGQFNRVAGSCYLELGDGLQARRRLQDAARVSGRSSKSRAIVLGNLALTHLRGGDVDASVAALHEAIDIIETTRGGGAMTIAFRAGRELRPWRASTRVHEVQDRLLSLFSG